MANHTHRFSVPRLLSIAISSSLLTIGIMSCSGSESGGITEVPPGTVVVEMPGNSFSPFNTIVKVNGSVAFDFPGDEHDVTFVSKVGAPASIPVTKSKVVTRTFTTVGVFDYDCKVHPGMSGQVTVTQ